jgi:gamma-glutamyltranspeptidase / glutathione hydrolase
MRIDTNSLLDKDYLASRAGGIRMNRIGQPVSAFPPEGGTVYLTAADAGGMMVSFIQSNYHGFGSGIVIPETGISLHNRGRGFSMKPGHPNRVNGSKRPYHTIIPAFVTRNDKPVMSFGIMGAHMQPQGHVQMILRIFQYGLNPQAALDAPRWHVGEDFSLSFEKGIRDSVIGDLERRGHRIEPGDPPMGLFGGGQVIFKRENGYCAASDPRKDGQAVGF